MQRIVWIDWAKAILIFLMVLGHNFPVRWQYDIIYAFHMPAFFIISGYLYHQHSWKRTLKSFGIPVMAFSLLNLAIYMLPKILRGKMDFSDLAARILLPFIGGYVPEHLDYIFVFPGVWFIIVLLLGRFLMGDVKIFSFIPKYVKYSLPLLCLFLVVEPFIFPNDSLAVYKPYLVVSCLPFMLFGYLMAKYEMANKFKLPLVAFLVVFLPVTFIQGSCNILNYKFGYSYILFFFNAILGSIILFTLCAKFSRPNRMIEIFSKGTILILAFNFNLKVFCSILFNKLGLGSFTEDTNVYPWIVIILTMAICYYPIKWLLAHHPILLGK